MGCKLTGEGSTPSLRVIGYAPRFLSSKFDHVYYSIQISLGPILNALQFQHLDGLFAPKIDQSPSFHSDLVGYHFVILNPTHCSLHTLKMGPNKIWIKWLIWSILGGKKIVYMLKIGGGGGVRNGTEQDMNKMVDTVKFGCKKIIQMLKMGDKTAVHTYWLSKWTITVLRIYQ